MCAHASYTRLLAAHVCSHRQVDPVSGAFPDLKAQTKCWNDRMWDVTQDQLYERACMCIADVWYLTAIDSMLQVRRSAVSDCVWRQVGACARRDGRVA